MKTRRTDESVVCIFERKGATTRAALISGLGLGGVTAVPLWIAAGPGVAMMALAAGVVAGAIGATMTGPVEVVIGLRGVRIRETFASYRGLRMRLRGDRLVLHGPDVAYESARLKNASELRPVLSWLEGTLEAGMLDRRHLDGLEKGLVLRSLEHTGRPTPMTLRFTSHGAEVVLDTRAPSLVQRALWWGPAILTSGAIAAVAIQLAAQDPAVLPGLIAVMGLPFAALGVWASRGHPAQVRIVLEGERVTFFDAESVGSEHILHRPDIKWAGVSDERLEVRATNGRQLITVPLADPSRLDDVVRWLRSGEATDTGRDATVGRATLERLVQRA